MMKGTHLSAGLTISTLVATMADVKLTIPFIAASALGAILPDADHPRTSIHRALLTIAVFVGGMYLLGIRDISYTIAFYLLPILAATMLSHHRGFTHSVAFVILILILSIALKYQYGIDIILPICIGIISHLLMDCFNPHGCELLAPFSGENYSLPITVTTGGVADFIIGAICTIYLMNQYIYPMTKLL